MCGPICVGVGEFPKGLQWLPKEQEILMNTFIKGGIALIIRFFFVASFCQNIFSCFPLQFPQRCQQTKSIVVTFPAPKFQPLISIP